MHAYIKNWIYILIKQLYIYYEGEGGEWFFEG
jgi:hypothetical protein